MNNQFYKPTTEDLQEFNLLIEVLYLKYPGPHPVQVFLGADYVGSRKCVPGIYRSGQSRYEKNTMYKGENIYAWRKGERVHEGFNRNSKDYIESTLYAREQADREALGFFQKVLTDLKSVELIYLTSEIIDAAKCLLKDNSNSETSIKNLKSKITAFSEKDKIDFAQHGIASLDQLRVLMDENSVGVVFPVNILKSLDKIFGVSLLPERYEIVSAGEYIESLESGKKANLMMPVLSGPNRRIVYNGSSPNIKIVNKDGSVSNLSGQDIKSVQIGDTKIIFEP